MGCIKLQYYYKQDRTENIAQGWLSVDPLAGKYPSLSPYAYCANNPVMLVDPNGMSFDWYQNDKGQLLWSAESKDAISFGGSTYSNIAVGDCLPDNLQTTGGVNLIISGHEKGDPLNDSWDTQSGYINAGNPSSNNIYAIANNKDDLIKAFEVTTSNFGQVNNAAIRSHGWEEGLTLGESSSDKFRPSSITTFNNKLSNSIIMGKNANVYFLSCNAYPLSKSFTSITGISSYGAWGLTGPNDQMGGFRSTMEGFYRHTGKGNPKETYIAPILNVKF